MFNNVWLILSLILVFKFSTFYQSKLWSIILSRILLALKMSHVKCFIFNAMLSLHIQTCEPRQSQHINPLKLQSRCIDKLWYFGHASIFYLLTILKFRIDEYTRSILWKPAPNSMKAHTLHSSESQIERKRIKCLNPKHCVPLKICLDPNYKANDIFDIGSEHSSIQNKKECGIL